MLSQLQCSLAFHFIPGLGPSHYWQFVEHFGSITCAFRDGLDELKRAAGERGTALVKEFEQRGEHSELYLCVERELAQCAKAGVVLIDETQDDYPPLLHQTERCPPLLYVLGEPAVLSTPQIAMVGSRSPSPVGQSLAFEFARDLASAGFAITSGLALGIDACAHRGALAADNGAAPTVAVLGSGLANIYPRRNRGLADQILAGGGAIVSEFSMCTPARAPHFPQRNRIVSGLSCGTLVVEAALKSGSLITARLALQQNRDVFAIPGSIRSEVSRGCHALIKSGAKLVESPLDIVAELESLVQYHADLLQGPTSPESPGSDASELSALLTVIGFESTSLDQIAHRAAQPIAELLPLLLQLELSGRIENTGLGYVRL